MIAAVITRGLSVDTPYFIATAGLTPGASVASDPAYSLFRGTTTGGDVFRGAATSGGGTFRGTITPGGDTFR
jgi:hypothetical protein